MLWTEVRRWAKENGYESFREKIKDSDNRYDYYWSKIDDPQCSGIANSVSNLASIIYNDMTNNAWIEHQNNYIKNYTINSVSNYGS